MDEDGRHRAAAELLRRLAEAVADERLPIHRRREDVWPDVTVPHDTAALLESLEELLNRAVLRRLPPRIADVGQLTDGRRAQLPQGLQHGQFGAGDVEVELRGRHPRLLR